jgi:hypothetical protein
MAGKQTYLEEENNEKTYARIYEPFGGSNDLRRSISEKGNDEYGRGYKVIGDAYSFTPWPGTPFSGIPRRLQGGGFFLTVKTFEETDQDRYLNCYAYALGTFGKDLEKLAEKKMEEIQKSVSLSINEVVKRYFTTVIAPEEGDLVIYSISSGITIRTPGGSRVSGTTHAGIYRKSNPNWNSPEGGTVESKWGWFYNSCVFQHDVFFVPDFYGDTVKFYRLKKISAQ